MELSPKQQVTELIRKFSRILLVTHARPDGDALGSVLALHQVLKALGKEPSTVVLDDIPGTYQFMPAIDQLSKELTGSRELVISVDTSQVPVDKLKYNTRDNKLNIIVTPKQGAYSEQDVTLESGSYKYDLIIVVDAPDLDRLGKIYEQNPDLFYETPVVNIDHHPSNDYFGAVNLVDLTATSTCEILVGVIESLGDSLMTEDVATSLLTGLITDTGSFQNSNTTPKSLTVSAQLVAAGGRQQEIVQHVYKTKPLSTLKLWGRALTKLQYDAEARLVWSSINAKDFADTGGTASEAKEVIDALMSSAPDAEIILLLRDNDGKVDGSVRTTKGVDAIKIVAPWGGGGHTGAAGFDVPGPLAEAEPKVVQTIREWQLKRLQGEGATKAVPALPSTDPAEALAPTSETPEPEDDETPDPTAHPVPATVGDALKIAEKARGEEPAPAPTKPPGRQEPLTDDELDAYFRKTLGGQDEVIDQPAQPKPSSDTQ